MCCEVRVACCGEQGAGSRVQGTRYKVKSQITVPFRKIMKNFKIIILILLVSITGCRRGGAKLEVFGLEVLPAADSTLLFDGKSLGKWEITNFGPQGPVYVSDGSIILGMGDGCTGVTWTGPVPEANYEITLQAKKVDGNDFFCGLTFPVEKDPCTLIVGGWGGTTVGLSCINGYDASENETTSLMSFEKDRWYNIRLRVTPDSVNAWIDQAKVVAFAIGEKRISIRPEVDLSRPLGIASWRTTAAIRNIRIRPIEWSRNH